MRIQIQIVTWNSAPYLGRLFQGIDKQNGVDYKILVIDNASEDNTVEWLRLNRPDTELIQNHKNLGFAKANNQGFEMCQAPYVLVLNPDTELQSGFLKQVMEIMETDGKIASVGGKLYRRLPEGGKYGIIDSCGLAMRLNGRVVDKGAGKPDNGQFDGKTQVFGISGACALYRLRSLKNVADKYGIFDIRFGSYKEDVDLAWRLQTNGYQARFTPLAAAWHKREVQKGDRGVRVDEIKKLSIHNHLLMLKKNLSRRDWRRLPFILGYELAKFAYVALFERKNLNAYHEIL